jgi:hypothetical protein
MTSRVSVSCVAFKNATYRALIGGENARDTDESESGTEKANCNWGKTDTVSVFAFIQVMVSGSSFPLVSKMHDTLRHIMTVAIDFKQGIFTERMSLYCSILLMEYY